MSTIEELSALAVRRTDLSVNDSQRILYLLNTMDQPSSTAYEFHYPLELGILLRGRMRRVFPSGDVVLEPGQVWFCGMWEPHGYQIVESPCHRAVLMIHPPLLAETRFEEMPTHNWLLPFAIAPQSRPQVDSQSRGKMLSLAERLMEAGRHSGSQRQVRLRLLLLEALLQITDGWHPQSENTTLPPDDYERVKQAIDSVFSSRKRINTGEAAKMCGLSRNRFSSIFHSITGITFSDFALRFRLSSAARQLTCSSDPLKAIARDWGFNDESHFCRAFLLHYGQTPTQYRKKVLLESVPQENQFHDPPELMEAVPPQS